MIKYVLRQNLNNSMTKAYGKYYAYPVVDETVDLAALARHMEEHNTGFSEAMCIGVLKSMVKCIKEQLLAGRNVKIDDLAIFSVGIRNNGGTVTEEEFSTGTNILGVRLRARATGTLSTANLNLAASLKKASTVTSSSSASESADATDAGSTTTNFTLTVNATPTNGGTVTGGGSYASGAQATLVATPASGYTFTKWSDGVTTASRTVTVTADTTLTATFTASGSSSGTSTGGSTTGDDLMG